MAKLVAWDVKDERPEEGFEKADIEMAAELIK